EIKPNLPEGMAFVIPSDDAIFINESISEVMRTLGIAVLIVILVNFAFLASLRATLVPSITIPVSVIGTFIGISALGFSINVLTLLALILSIGIVVDDAIVVLENIQRRVEAGEKRMIAAVLGSRQVMFAVLATTLTLVAVFVPISFMEGTVGKLFGEFGFVLAVSVAISTLVALTLCPMLCSRILKRGDGANAASRWLDKSFDRLANSYRRGLAGAINKAPLVLAIAVGFAGLSYFAYEALPKELTPQEDRGVFFVAISAPQGANVSYTDKEVRTAERSMDYLYANGEAEHVLGFAGTRGRPHEGFVVVRLTHWDERGRHSTKTVREVNDKLMAQPGIRAMAINPAGLGLRGSRHPLRVVIGGPDYESVEKWSEEIIRKAQQNPGLLDVDTDLERNQPQLSVKIDRSRADDMGVRVASIARALQTLLASREVTTYVDRGREYSVILKARNEDRQTPQDLKNIFVRSDRSGELVPLTALVTLESEAAAPTLRRYNRLPSVTISASLESGYSLGEAIKYMEALASETLPSEARLGFGGQSQQFLETSSGVALVFGMALLIVFLVLAAQFESFVHPLIIMLSVPLAISGALMALLITGNSLNIYSQVGLVLLVGLMAKNGILIVEFANQLRDEGRSVREAVLEASAVRLRPILMTVVSTVLGAAPLVFASGAGAESRFAIGTVIIGGLSIASGMTLFLTPVLYDLLARFSTPIRVTGDALDAELADSQPSPSAAE
ncbi:MAG: efflux RND transporter permease subunit, partial [Parvibaculaceae bacterium]|nr:efflux RND transporter permease subunit [Parvibaculaceae bacterium]